MGIFLDENFKESVKGKYCLLDNDFLGALFNDNSLFLAMTDILKDYPSNALILSRIYAQNDSKLKIKNSASFVDIYMASKLMALGGKYLLITGNKKDFPCYIFDTKGIIVQESENGTLKNFSLLSFNSSKFDKCNGDLGSVGK